MTSTVLDVTVCLLCLSAGVGVLANAGAVDSHGAASTPNADAAGDVIAGTTASVEYRRASDERREEGDPGESDASRNGTHHATLAELIAGAASRTGTSGESRSGGVQDSGSGDYAAAVRNAASEAIRTALDGRVRVTARREAGSDGAGSFVVGEHPPETSRVDVAVLSVAGTRPTTRTTPEAGSKAGRDSEERAVRTTSTVRIIVEAW